MTTAEAVAEIRRLTALTSVIPLKQDLLENALQAVAAHGLPLWDAQIFAAAKLHQATAALSEDFQHRQTIDGITFLNPFAPDFSLFEVTGEADRP